MKIIPFLFASFCLELIFPSKCLGIVLLKHYLWISPYLLAILLTCGVGLDEIDKTQF